MQRTVDLITDVAAILGEIVELKIYVGPRVALPMVTLPSGGGVWGGGSEVKVREGTRSERSGGRKRPERERRGGEQFIFRPVRDTLGRTMPYCNTDLL